MQDVYEPTPCNISASIVEHVSQTIEISSSYSDMPKTKAVAVSSFHDVPLAGCQDPAY